MDQLEKEAAAGTTAEVYVQQFRNGSNVKLQMSIEVENYAEDDLPKILSFIAECSRKFYLSTGNQISSKP